MTQRDRDRLVVLQKARKKLITQQQAAAERLWERTQELLERRRPKSSGTLLAILAVSVLRLTTNGFALPSIYMRMPFVLEVPS